MAAMTDKKRFKKALRIVQEILEDNIHGAGDETTKFYRQLTVLEATLNAIRVVGDEPDGQAGATDGDRVP